MYRPGAMNEDADSLSRQDWERMDEEKEAIEEGDEVSD